MINYNVKRVLVIESTKYGYDGISNVITNYYMYQNHNEIHMDLVTLNTISQFLLEEFKRNNSINFVLPYRNNDTLKYMINLYQIMKHGHYDIVHVHGCSSTMAVEMLVAKIADIKIRIAHSHNTKCDHNMIDKLLRPFFYTFCNVAFACGEEAGKWLFPHRKFDVIYNGVDLEKYQYNGIVRKQMRNKYGIQNKLVIGHVGRFSEQKNHKKIIEIFKEISKVRSDAVLVLVGDGELKEDIQNLVNMSKLNVLFVGLSNEVERWLQAMDVMIFPSLFEGLPLGLVEAQASGLPCFLSDTISRDTKITDLVEFIPLMEKSEVWAEKVLNVIGKYKRADRIEYVKTQIRDAHFDIKYNCKELSKKYNVLLNKRRNL